jgi:predicted XRE-type DNA-binding protein
MEKQLENTKAHSILDCMAKLLETTREALRNSKVSRYRIAKDTGISEATLSLFVNGKHSNLGMSHVETLLDYLGYEVEIVKQESEAE